eukprot:9063576-Ditylum_brightwellii.AAC.1
MNEFHPLALVAGTKVNPNVLNHREAMNAEDHELFIQAMEEEIKRMVEKGILKWSHTHVFSHIKKFLEQSGHTEEKQNQQVKSTVTDPISVLMAANSNMA